MWSVAVDGRPVRPGTGPKGSVLVPLPKRRGGSDAARVIVGLMYADTAAAWGPSGEWRLTLPAVFDTRYERQSDATGRMVWALRKRAPSPSPPSTPTYTAAPPADE